MKIIVRLELTYYLLFRNEVLLGFQILGKIDYKCHLFSYKNELWKKKQCFHKKILFPRRMESRQILIYYINKDNV